MDVCVCVCVCVCGQMTLRRFIPEKEPRYPSKRSLGGPQEPVCTFWWSEKSLAATRIRTPDRSARSWITNQFHILYNYVKYFIVSKYVILGLPITSHIMCVYVCMYVCDIAFAYQTAPASVAL
jgi:hypothetical protein